MQLRTHWVSDWLQPVGCTWVCARRQSAVHQVLAEVKIKIKQYKAEMGSS
jgi:hypothetical protein